MELSFAPTQLWGLTYAYRTHYKLYICDIHSMEPYAMFQGALRFKTYPVYKVDVAGVVVWVDENSRFYVYGLDDGTGVIKVCYLKDRSSDETPVVKYSLGDYLHVRGKIQTFRDEKEVFAFEYFHIEDPMFEVLRMQELLALYTNKYSLPFTIPYKIQQEIKMYKSGKAWLCRLLSTDSVMSVMEKCGRFRIADLIADGTLTELAPAASISDIQEALTYIIATMEIEGMVYRLGCDDYTYQLNGGLHCTLRGTVEKALKSGRHRHEKGCDYVWVWERVRASSNQMRRIKQSAIHKCLKGLESESRVVSLVSQHYTLLNDT